MWTLLLRALNVIPGIALWRRFKTAVPGRSSQPPPLAGIIVSIIAQRFKSAAPSATAQVLELAVELKRRGEPVIGLSAGEPDFDTPENIQAAALAAMKAGKTRYVPPSGLFELREAICAKLRRDNGLIYAPNEVSVGAGAKQSIFSALMATLEPGDEVIIPAPYWVSFADIVSMMGAKAIPIAGSFEQDFKIGSEILERAITPRTKWLILCSPSNPTGAIYSHDELLALAHALHRHPHVWVMFDHIYEKLVFDGVPAKTIAEVDPALQARSVIVNGLSKAHCMTGWRVGYIAGPKQIISAVNAIQSQSTTSACTISQWASVEALVGDQRYIDANNVQYKRRRELVVERLNAIRGIECHRPSGAFYVYPSIAALIGARTPDGKRIESDSDFVSYVLREALVAIVPGAAFHMSPFFRLAYSASTEELEEALQRLATACNRLS